MKRLKSPKRIFIRIVIAGIAVGLFGCSFAENQYSPEQVIQNALEETAEIGAYYAEEEIIYRGNGQEIEHLIIKDWYSGDGKIRSETANKDGSDKTIAVNDGTSFTTYFVDQNEVFIFENPNHSFSQPSSKEQSEMLLKTIEDTHTVSMKGEKRIANRMAYHLLAKANEESVLLGDLEYWIDQENWMILKTISNTGDGKLETVYTTIDFDVEIPSAIFTIDLPEDVTNLSVEDNSGATEVAITIEEAAEIMGKSLLYFPENEEREIAKVEKKELGGESQRKEVNIDYEKDGLPLFSFSVFEVSEQIAHEDSKYPGEKHVKIRGQEGTSLELDDFRSVFWEENGLSYSVVLVNPNLTFEELIDMTAEMRFFK